MSSKDLLTYKEMVEIDNEGSDSLTPITAEYLLKDNSKVDDLLQWLQEAGEYFQTDESTGAIVVYKVCK